MPNFWIAVLPEHVDEADGDQYCSKRHDSPADSSGQSLAWGDRHGHAPDLSGSFMPNTEGGTRTHTPLTGNGF